MEKEFKSYQRLIKYFLLALFAFYFIILILLLYREEYDRNTKLRELKNTEKNIMITYSKVIAKDVGNIVADLKFLEQTYSFNLEDRLGIENQWFLFCKNKHIYDQIRYIDEFGKEKIKVTYNYGSNECRRIDGDNLLNKSDSSYVEETFELDAEEIFISRLDLQIKDGKIEEPIKPIIRISTPIYDRGENLDGMIVLNYLAKNIIEEIKDISKFSNGQVYLLNKDGYFLYSDKEEEWGFMYEDGKDLNFKNKFNEAWDMIEEGGNEIITDEGLFIVSRINFEEIFKYDKKNILRNKEIISENDWVIVSYIDRDGSFCDAFEASLFSRIKEINKKNMLYFINIVFISIIVSLLAYVIHNSYLKTKFFSRYDSMTGTLNRRAGFIKLKKDMEAHSKNGYDMCICFIDVDGLKQVNDVLGHNAGDELILTAIKIIKNTIRDSDYIMRTGGDEFLIVFNNVDKVNTENVWNRINLQFEKINSEEDREYNISISHGIVEINKDEKLSIEELITLADEEMYINKNANKDKKIIKNI